MEATAFFSPLVCEGLCTWTDIRTGRVDLADCFEMKMLLEWRNYSAAVVRAKQEEGNADS
jgi:hypothetical protein